MSRLSRPYIPLDIRLTVALRQLGVPKIHIIEQVFAASRQRRVKIRLSQILQSLFSMDQYHLDHDPALENREFNPHTKKYEPEANNPDYLVYRTKENHRIKTLVHGDGAQLSDAAKARKRKRKARKARRQKRLWPSRPLRSANRWPKRKEITSSGSK